jgi:hypothetical protein
LVEPEPLSFYWSRSLHRFGGAGASHHLMRHRFRVRNGSDSFIHTLDT